MSFRSSLLLSLLCVPLAWADHQGGLPLAEVLNNVQQAESSLQTLELRFVQRISRRDLPTEVIKGELAYQKPGQVRIVQSAPDKQVLVSDGKEVKIYTPAAGQVLVGAWKHWIEQSNFPAPLLSFIGDFPAERWDQRYRVLFGGYDHDAYRLRFKPKRSEDVPLELWVSDDTFLPRRGRLLGPDVTVDVEFDRVRVNAPLASGTFRPSIPKSAVVVPMPS